MNKKILQLFVAIITIFIAVWFWGYMTSPKSFDECVLKNIDNAKSDNSASAVYRSCEEKFKNSRVVTFVEVPLSHQEISKLDTEFSYSLEKNTVYLKIYNGNERLTISSLILEIRVHDDSTPRVYDYLIKEKVNPLSVREVSLNVMAIPVEKKIKWSWKIKSAKGY